VRLNALFNPARDPCAENGRPLRGEPVFGDGDGRSSTRGDDRGNQAAFRFYMTILAVLIFVNQPDGDLAVSAEGSPTNDASEG
jgi:hypothetical protein